MSRKALLVSTLLMIPLPVLAQTTSTLSAETGNNTSAASFPQHDNGNVAAGNVSKLDIHGLLYPGATTKVYAHFQPWFCMPGTVGSDGIVRCNGHITTGYNSDDAAQVKKQIDDMVSRGVQGLVIDWYGQYAAIENNTSLRVMNEAQSRTGFEFAIMEDKGAVSQCMSHNPGLSATQCTINDLNYVASTYYPSPAYMYRNGRPVVFFFIAESEPIDWNAVRAGVQGNPYFIFEDNFGHAQGDGAFAWVRPGTLGGPQPDFQGYLADFYDKAKAKANRSKIPFGAGFKGFDDRHATWAPSPPLFMDQECGQTWLKAIDVIEQKWDSGDQLANLQLVTWNDYDEGTEIESGIDNCLSVAATVAGNRASWTLPGSGLESTLDGYRIWRATAGSNLTLQGEVMVGAHSFDLSGLPAGSYTIYVQAVGKPMLLNHMSNGVAVAQVNNIDDLSGWQYCTTPSCSGGQGTATSALTKDTTSRDGRSARFDLRGGTGYSNARWWNQIASTGWTTKHFAYDFYAYVSNPNAPQAFEFDWAVILNGKRYYFGQQCDFKESHRWRVWSNNTWTATSRGCAVFQGTWNHFILHGEITADNRVHYQNVVINDTTYTFDLYATPSSRRGSSTTVYLQLDGNASQTPYSLRVDNVKFSSW